MTVVLVTGGAGYVGSHACKALAAGGFEPVAYDNLLHGHRRAVRWGPLEVGDLGEPGRLAEVFDRYRPDAVMHFAGLTAVGESVRDPQAYYQTNVAMTLSLLASMGRAGVGTLVFSSSAAVYGSPRSLPIGEDAPLEPSSPYGRSKVMVEQMLADHGRAYGLRWAALRYFNAAGADPDGETGETHTPETHLIPRALMAVAGEIPCLEVFGADWPTEDGTCVRDYVHVADLAAMHVAALRHLRGSGVSGAFNLGTGSGHSVREVIGAVERVTGRVVPLRFGPRRDGDPAVLVADPAKARTVLSVDARHTDLDETIAHAWHWYGKTH